MRPRAIAVLWPCETIRLSQLNRQTVTSNRIWGRLDHRQLGSQPCQLHRQLAIACQLPGLGEHTPSHRADQHWHPTPAAPTRRGRVSRRSPTRADRCDRNALRTPRRCLCPTTRATPHRAAGSTSTAVHSPDRERCDGGRVCATRQPRRRSRLHRHTRPGRAWALRHQTIRTGAAKTQPGNVDTDEFGHL